MIDLVASTVSETSIGMIDFVASTVSTSSCLLTRLVSRSGVGAGGGATRTAITAAMATASHTDTADSVIRGMTIDLRLCGCRAGWLGGASSMGLLMESWD